MKKLIKALIYMDIEEDKMPTLLADVKGELLRLNSLYIKYGVGSIKVTTTGFDSTKDCFRGGWGIETPVGK